ncbi:tetratricopeptide repeat protein [Streptomyces sp. NBC_01268]|uniref:tetratricopeptide repeat protein n=1 Tax=Streptomyces sp. NBC_01268 TaxID=2903806 RepID=UPI002E2F9073|nr:tetratricopeptide repeat protein [Streptomyces sp. NBC_01268]
MAHDPTTRGGAVAHNSVTGGTHGTVVQAGHIEHLVVQQGPPPADEVTVAPPWGRRGTPLRGRDELLARLRTAHGTHVLYGLGGVGKTSLALEAARGFAAGGAPVWWVAAQDSGRLAGGLRAVARRVGLREDELAAGQTADLLWERLGALPGPWLLVVDNADELALLDGPGSLAAGTGWVRIPAGAGGLVLVTTRDGDLAAWGAGPALHPLGALPGEEGARVLADRAGEEAGPMADAEPLAVRLGGLPLALDSAGRYLASVTERPAFLRTPGEPATYGAYLAALGTGDLAVDGDGTLARIWAMSLRLLRDRGHAHAEELLRVLAGFADAPVPLRVFAPERLTIPPGELWSCLQALDLLGLVSLRADGEPVVMLHPLVRDAYRGERERLSAELAVRVEDPKALVPLWPLLVPHLLDDLGPGVDETGWTGAVRAVRSLSARGLVLEAVERGLAVHEGAARHLPAGHRTVLAAGCEYGDALLASGREDEALHVLDRLIEESAAAAGSDELLVVRARNLRGVALHQCGDLEAARAEFTALIEGESRLLGDDDQQALAARANLAMILAQLHRTEDALAEMDIVLAAGTRLLGPDDRDTLTTRMNRAWILRELGEAETAREEAEAVVEARGRRFGPDHPDTLAARFNLATMLDPATAHAELAAVLDARTRVLGLDNPVTVATREALERTRRTLPG